MNYKSILIGGIALMGACSLWAQDCPSFNAPAGGKAVKVTFFTETAECFTVSDPNGAINPSPSKRVTFYMDYGTLKTKTKLNNGTELAKPVMVTNTAMASVVYELVYNEKKGEWDLKNRVMQGDVTEAQHEKQAEEHDQRVADQKAKQEADQKAWDEKRDAEKAERERIAAEEKAKEAEKPKMGLSAYEDNRQGIQGRTDLDKNNQSGTGSDSKAGSGSANANAGSGATSTPSGSGEAATTGGSGDGSGATVTVKADHPPGYPYAYAFYYNNRPIKNAKWVVKTLWDKPQKELMSATSDDQGVVVFYTMLETGTYEIEFCLEIDGKQYDGFSGKMTLGNTSNSAIVMDFGDYVTRYAKMANTSTSKVEADKGLDKVLK